MFKNDNQKENKNPNQSKNNNNIPFVSVKNLDINNFNKEQLQSIVDAQIAENKKSSKNWTLILSLSLIFIIVGISLLPTALTSVTDKNVYLGLIFAGVFALFLGFVMAVMGLWKKISLSKYNKFLEEPLETDEDIADREIKEKIVGSKRRIDEETDEDKKMKEQSQLEFLRHLEEERMLRKKNNMKNFEGKSSENNKKGTD